MRTTIGASVVALFAFVVAAVALVGTVRTSQIRSIDSALELRAIGIESLIDGGASPSSVAVESDESGVVQIVDDRGAIVAASDNITGDDLLTARSPASTATERVAALDGESFRILVHATDGVQRYTIIVGTTLEDVERTRDVLLGALAVGIPALLVLIAAMVWYVVGRSLRPVEAIRSQVASIGGRELDRRVPVPAARDEIGRLATTMNEMLDRLESANTRQARFVSDAAHELRTPIAIIRHELEVALRVDADEHWRDTAQDALDEDLRMQRLVEDLLFMARREPTDDAIPVAGRELVDLDDVTLDEVHRNRGSGHVDTSRVSAGQVRGHADQLGRVVRNLLDNALRHASLRVAIEVTTEHGEVLLHVDDDGQGVTEDDRHRVFERFSRTDESRSRDDGGSGLGLAIVADIVADHGGRVAVGDSPALGGARFTVTLPDARSVISSSSLAALP